MAVTAIPGVTGTPPSPWGAILSLILIAIGTGGIKVGGGRGLGVGVGVGWGVVGKTLTMGGPLRRPPAPVPLSPCALLPPPPCAHCAACRASAVCLGLWRRPVQGRPGAADGELLFHVLLFDQPGQLPLAAHHADPARRRGLVRVRGRAESGPGQGRGARAGRGEGRTGKGRGARAGRVLVRFALPHTSGLSRPGPFANALFRV